MNTKSKELHKKIKLALDCELEDHIRYLLEEIIVYLENEEE